MRFQIHKCTASCIRAKWNLCKRKYGQFCRYGFPRASCTSTTLNTIDGVLKSNINGGNRLKLYNLKRGVNETFVNDYNPTLLLLWASNVDLQYIGETSMALDRYITSYITKAEKNATEKIWEELNSNKSLKSRLYTLGLANFKARELGIYEVCDKLNGFKMCQFSNKVKFLNVFEKKERTRSIKKMSELDKMAPESKNIFHTNTIDDYYPNRPIEIEDCCLFEYESKYDYVTKVCAKDHSQCFKLQSNLGFIHRRADLKVLKLPHIKCIDEKSIEKYFHQLLMLFKPWRDEEELLGNKKTFFAAYLDAEKDKTLDTVQVQSHTERTKIINLAKEKVNQIQIEFNADQLIADNEIPPKLPEPSLEEADLGAFDLNVHKVDLELLNSNIESLNKDQRNVFDRVIRHTTLQEAQKNTKCNSSKPLSPLRIFCSGVAGL